MGCLVLRYYVISGATGMTGNELVRQILSRNNQDIVLGFDNFYASSIDTVGDCLDNPQFNFFEYNINNRAQMRQIEEMVLSEKNIYDELIYINCAAVVHTEHFYHVEETFETNVLGMKHFLESALRVKANKFINCSTSEVYSMNSWNENGGVSEDDFLVLATAEHSQRTSYATGKLLTEFFTKDAVNKNDILGCSIRFANVYSKNERYPKHIIPYIINSLKSYGKVVLLENSRRNKRTFLYNSDSCRAVLALLDSDSALDGSVYNVATDEEISILDLVKMCAKKMGIESFDIEFSGKRSSDPERRILSTKKIRAYTQWKPLVTLDEGIDECISFYCGEDL